MKVDFNSQTPKANPQFGRINLNDSERVIKRVLTKPSDIKVFKSIILVHNDIDSVDVNFFEKGKKSLYAKVAKTTPDFDCKNFSQRLFESPMHFIKRCCFYAQDWATKLKNKDIDINDVINLTK